MIVAALAGAAGLYTVLGQLCAVIYTESIQAILLLLGPGRLALRHDERRACGALALSAHRRSLGSPGPACSAHHH
jgi:hypothetical protein